MLSAFPGNLFTLLKTRNSNLDTLAVTLRHKPTRQKLKNVTRRKVSFCFEDAKLKIRVAVVHFDEFAFLIVFPLKARLGDESSSARARWAVPWPDSAHSQAVGSLRAH